MTENEVQEWLDDLTLLDGIETLSGQTHTARYATGSNEVFTSYLTGHPDGPPFA
jgi:hypothetical protein